MGETKSLKIMDVTIKEGGFRLHHRILAEQVADLAQELQRAGVRYAEISHGCGVGAFKAGFPGLVHDKEMLIAAKLAAPDLNVCIYVHPSLQAVPEIPPLLNHFQLARVGVNFNEPNSAMEHISLLKKNKKIVIGEILRAHSGSPKEIVRAAQELKKQGCEVIYLTDTFGSMDEEDVRNYLGELRSHIDLPLGFQGRNHLGRALSNTLMAIEAGTEWIDGGLMGMGNLGGVTNLEMLTTLLELQGRTTGLDLRELTLAAKNYALPVFGKPGRIALAALLSAKYKIDFYPMIFLEKLAELLEIPLEQAFSEIREGNPKAVQIREPQLRNFLSKHRLDYDVVLTFLKTGQVPEGVPSPE